LAEEIAKFPALLLGRIRLLAMRRVRFRDAKDLDIGLYLNRNPMGLSLQARATLDLIIGLAFSMNYDVVILYGIDLSSGYFWEAQEVPNGLHATARKRNDHLGMLDLVPLLRENLFLPYGKDIFVASKSSNLFPRVPLWEYQQEIISAPAEFI
jgi:hypothetical protein